MNQPFSQLIEINSNLNVNPCFLNFIITHEIDIFDSDTILIDSNCNMYLPFKEYQEEIVIPYLIKNNIWEFEPSLVEYPIILSDNCICCYEIGEKCSEESLYLNGYDLKPASRKKVNEYC